MKKILFPLVTAMLLAACKKDAETHHINILHPTGGTMGVVYADQTLDSIVLVTTDSYRCSSTESWMSIDPKIGTKTLQNLYQTVHIIPVPVTFEVNMTGAARIGNVNIYTYGNDWNQQITTGFVQMGWPNIQRPAALITYNEAKPGKAIFELVLPAQEVKDSLIFDVRENWTLEGNGAFVTPASRSGRNGRNVVMLSVEPNATKDARTDTFVLTTSGLSTTIKVTQQAAAR